MLFRLFSYALSSLLAISLFDICHIKTLGFALVNITPTEFDDFESGVDKGTIDPILNQNFYLFAKGGQTYAFESEDHQYVLKLFKFQHLRIPPILKWLPLTGHLDKLKQKKIGYKASMLKKAYQSYRDAFFYFKEEALLEEINLSNKKNRYQSRLTIYDAQKIRFELDPNTTPFILQKKVVLFESAIQNHLKVGDFSFVKEAICSCIDLLMKRIDLGFIDNDCYLHKNIGLIGSKAMLLDIGTLEKTPNLTHETKVKQLSYVLESVFQMIEPYPKLQTEIKEYFLKTCDQL